MKALKRDGSGVFVTGIRFIKCETEIGAGALGRFACVYWLGEKL